MALTYGGKAPRTPSGVKFLTARARTTHEFYKTSQRGTEVRVYPEIGADGTARPLRLGPEFTDVTNWIDEHFVIAYKGGVPSHKNRLSMIVEVRGDSLAAQVTKGKDIWDRLRNTAQAGVDEGTNPEWYKLIREGKNAAIGPKSKSKAKLHTFVQGALTLVNTGKGQMNNISRKKPLANSILMLSPNATDALVQLIQMEDPNYHGPADDFARRFVNGSLLDPTDGKLVLFRQPGARSGGGDDTPDFDGRGGGGATEDDDLQFKIEAIATDRYKVPLEVMRKHWRPWNELLQIWESEQHLVEALCDGFPDDLMIAAFGETDWLPDSVRKAKVYNVPPAAAAGASASPATSAGSAASAPQEETEEDEGVDWEANSRAGSSEDANARDHMDFPPPEEEAEAAAPAPEAAAATVDQPTGDPANPADPANMMQQLAAARRKVGAAK